MSKGYRILDPELLKEKKVFVKYVLMSCANPECGKTWGVVLDPDRQEMSEESITCFTCMAKEVLKKMEG